MVENGQKIQKSQKSKSHFFLIFFVFEIFSFSLKKNAILLVFQYYKDAIRPELSSPAGVIVVAGQYFPYLI